MSDERAAALAAAYEAGRTSGAEHLCGLDARDVDELALEVIGAIGHAPNDGGSWLALAEAVLILLRRHVEIWPVDADETERVAELLVALGAHVDGHTGNIGPTRAGAIGAVLSDLIESRGGEIGRERIALWGLQKLGLVVDDACAATFSDWLEAAPTLLIKPWRVYPVARIDPRSFVGRANTRPANLPMVTPESAFVNVRLGRAEHAMYEITLDWSLRGRLTPLAEATDLRVASLHLDEDRGDFRIDTSSVTNDGPEPSQERSATLDRAFGVAERQTSNVVVIPEYALSAEERAEVFARVARSEPRPVVLVGGSAFVDGYNEGWLVCGAGGGKPAERTFRKVNRALFDGREEGIRVERPGVVSVWRSGDLALAILICRDAQDQELVQLLMDAGVNVCLVPSFSSSVATIIGVVEPVATVCQGFVVVSVAPRTWDGVPRTEFYVRGPYGDDQGVPSVIEPSSLSSARKAGPGVWSVSSRQRIATWLEA